jgi:signal transduction histidine kinase
MADLFLYVTPRPLLMDVLIWTLLVVAIVACVVLIVWQKKTEKMLKNELKIIDLMKEHNVQNDFLLKALRIATWHMNVKDQQVVYDYDYRIRNNEWIYVAEDQLGKADEAVLLLHEQDSPRVAQSLRDLCEGKIEMYHEEYRVKIPNTNKVYWEESYATVAERGEDGLPTVVVGTSKSIDDRKAMEKALTEARYKAEESDRLKTAFLANMSHEVRTPLNAIVGFTSVLPDVTNPDERKMLLDLINENTQKLLTIVDDVVSISKVESGQEELVLSDFDLSVALNEVVDLFMSKVQSGVTLSTQFAVPSLNINADRSRLVDVVRHLVSNAVKFTSQGSVVVGFDAPENGLLHIWVRDTGKGIAPEHHEKIFERFFKVDEFIPGAGLGLSTSRTLAYSMNGSIVVDSALGEGSTFIFEIPI